MSSRGVVLLLITLLMLPLLAAVATAEHEWYHRYDITGTVTDPDGDPVRRKSVSLDCSSGASAPGICDGNDGRQVKTSIFTGDYTLSLHLHASDHGETIVLLVEGEQFEHVIDMEGSDGEAEERDRTSSMNIELTEPADYTMDLIGLAVFLALLGASTAFILRKIGYSPLAGRKEAVGRASKRALDEDLLALCPRCDAKVKPVNLLRHLTQKHHLPKSEAEALLDDGRDDGDESE